MQNGEALSSAVICTSVQVVLFSKFQLSLLELSLVPISSLCRGEGSHGSRSRDWETSGDVGPLLPARNSNLILSLLELSLVPESSLLRSEGSYSGGSWKRKAGNNVGPLLPSSKLCFMGSELSLVSLKSPVPFGLSLWVALQGEDRLGSRKGEGPLRPTSNMGKGISNVLLLTQDPGLLLLQAT